MKRVLRQIGGAIVFYTRLPLPHTWPLVFDRIARWAPWIGLLLGAYLTSIDSLLQILQVPMLTRSAGVVLLWLWATGGLHLDGVIDTADGLAVDPQRRLEVMADSRTGAFGVMGAITILVLKTAALSDITMHRPLALMTAAAWGRWAQVVAIARYPYLRVSGKGALHRTHLKLPWDMISGLIPLLGLSLATYVWTATPWQLILLNLLVVSLLCLGVGAWFYRQFQGMTGDIYGAIVEWAETLILVYFTVQHAVPAINTSLVKTLHQSISTL